MEDKKLNQTKELGNEIDNISNELEDSHDGIIDNKDKTDNQEAYDSNDLSEDNTETNESLQVSQEELGQEKTISEPKLERILSDDDFETKLHQMSYLGKKQIIEDNDHIIIKKRSILRFISAVLIIAIIGGFTVGVGYRTMDYFFLNNRPESTIKYVPEFEQVSSDTFNLNNFSVTNIAQAVEPSVVSITNQVVEKNFFGEQTGTSAGSGVIFDISTERIFILTNHHVIDGSTELNVSFFGEKNFNAKIIGSDPDTDLAVVTVDSSIIDQNILSRIRSIEIGDSDKILVGEPAIAVGNPLGYNNTVTVGIISALDRFISDDLNSLSLIQTDAAINPGNSGGALVNSKAQLVGINTVKISATDVEGIGFAIPINSALPILEQLIEKGHVTKPFIGIYGANISKENAELYGVPLGVVVRDTVSNGPAFKAGLERYDIITKIDGVSITSMETLTGALAKLRVGDTIIIEVHRELPKVTEDSKAEFEVLEIELIIGDSHNY